MFMKFKTIPILSILLIGCSNNGSSIVLSGSNSEISIEKNNVSKEELMLIQNGINIYGNIYKPNDFSLDFKYSLLIMSHSANVNSDTLDSYGMRSAELGFLAYSFDYPGSSKNSRSDSISECTIFSEIDNLRFVINYFYNQEYIENIFLFGTSQGGLISSVVADEMKEIISGMILFYPAYNIPELLLKYPYGISDDYLNQLNDYDVYDNIGKFEKDVLIEHGTNDMVVPCSYSEKANELYKNSTLKLIEGANHGFNKENYAMDNKYDDETWGYVKDFLKLHY